MRKPPPVSWTTATARTLWVAMAMSIVLPGGLLGQGPGDSGAGATADAAGAADGAGPEWQILERHPGEGEQCLVCSQSIDDETAVAIRYKGRVFHVKESMLEEFRSDPDAYFRQLEARSGLFDEQAVGRRPPWTGWLVFGVYVVAGLVCGALAVGLALRRSRRALPWFFAGLVGNVLALIALLLAGPAAGGPRTLPAGLAKIPSTRAPLPCPHCGAENHPSASACTTCGGAIAPVVSAETGLSEGRAS